jgi:hypothetical protein
MALRWTRLEAAAKALGATLRLLASAYSRETERLQEVLEWDLWPAAEGWSVR